MRALLEHHCKDPDSPLELITMEFIPFPDYGGGAKYSIFADNVACAKWVRESYSDMANNAQSKPSLPRRGAG
jgi:hypothetical protein